MRYASLLLIVGALIAASSASPPQRRSSSRSTLTIYVGKHGVAGGPKKFAVHKNAHVVLVVHSTIGEAVHLHGYDIEKPIRSKTVPVRLPFVAKVTGVFEIELHLTETRGLRIALLTVK